MTSDLSRTKAVFSIAIFLRAILLLWGSYQDGVSSVKYTDIDYFVFTDAARLVSQGQSPFDRETYRYTPILSWLLVPTTTWFAFGKVLFAIGDIVAGWLILAILQSSYGFSRHRALNYTCIWLLNPIVAQISTRGSSEGLLGVIVISLLWASKNQRPILTGFLLGLAVHFKIYPFVYGLSILQNIEDSPNEKTSKSNIIKRFKTLIFSRTRLLVVSTSILTFMVLNALMFKVYGVAFIQQSYLHHLIRLDHRHNFSVYNIGLYMNTIRRSSSFVRPESLAFLPQLLVSAIAIPIALADKNLASTMFAQTFAFVMFNKVCTSQYFLWYIVLMPFYLPSSSFVRSPFKGIVAAASWLTGQVIWLQQGYNLEFLGDSRFVRGMWIASVVFFIVNTCLLSIVITDIANVKSILRFSISRKMR